MRYFLFYFWFPTERGELIGRCYNVVVPYPPSPPPPPQGSIVAAGGEMLRECLSLLLSSVDSRQQSEVVCGMSLCLHNSARATVPKALSMLSRSINPSRTSQPCDLSQYIIARHVHPSVFVAVRLRLRTTTSRVGQVTGVWLCSRDGQNLNLLLRCLL